MERYTRLKLEVLLCLLHTAARYQGWILEVGLWDTCAPAWEQHDRPDVVAGPGAGLERYGWKITGCLSLMSDGKGRFSVPANGKRTKVRRTICRTWRDLMEYWED